MDILTKRVKANIRTAGKVRRVHYLTVMQSFKPGKENTDAISQYNNIHNLRRYPVSRYNINIWPGPTGLYSSENLFSKVKARMRNVTLRQITRGEPPCSVCPCYTLCHVKRKTCKMKNEGQPTYYVLSLR